jgi:PAS domain S-box-containing protein
MEYGSSRLGSIRRRIIVLFCACALVPAFVLTALVMQLRSDDVQASKQLLSAVAQLADEQTSRTLQSVERAVERVDAMIGTFAETDQELRKVVAERPYLAAVHVLDALGRVTSSSDLDHGELDLSGQAYFRHRRDNTTLTFAYGDPVRNAVANKWIIPALRSRFTETGEFAGVVVAEVDPLYFNRVWSVDQALPQLSVTLFRADGMMLMRSPFSETLIGTTYTSQYVFERIRAGVLTGTFQNISGVDGLERIFAFRRLTSYPGMVLVIGQGADHVLLSWRRTAWVVGLGWLAAMLMMAALTVWLLREWERRQTTEQRYRMLFESNPYSAVLIDAETGRFLDVNAAAIELYGFSREEFLAMKATDLTVPEDIPAAEAMRHDAVDHDTTAIRELRHRCRDGKIVSVETSVRRIEIDGRTALMTIAQDVTGRRAIEEQLRQSQKMEAVGQLTGGIAHDFNNMLTVILANADALQENDASDDKSLPERVEQIGAAVVRASDLTRQLLAFSRKQALDPKRTDLNDLVGSTRKLLRRALGEQVEIDAVLAEDLWTINIDRTQLETALVNLCVNARDAMPNGGKLLIETRNVMLEADGQTQAAGVAPGPYAMLAVTDTGTGMPPEILAKVFDPFFTTKESGKGTGLGLSMVYGFIKQSNGHVRVYSEVGRGTTFKLYLPRIEGVHEEAEVWEKAPLPRGVERILLVEDEPQVRSSVAQQLRSLGYDVSEASDGASGVTACAAASQPFDLLLTDVVMPGALNGRALADEVARRWPVTRIVFMSGYTGGAIVQHGHLDPGVTLLSKPFRKADLAKTIRHALDDRAQGNALPEAA